jgi:lysophospholipase L1-like esterase
MKNGERSMQMVVGYNSIAFGSNSTPAWQKGFVARFRSQLDSKYGAAGTGILYPIDTVMADETRVVESGTAWAFFGRGAFNVGARQGVTGSVLTVGPVVCDSFDFNAISGGGSTVTVAIDGGAAQTFTITANGENFTKITKAAGALGSHTAVLTVTAGNFYSVGPEGTATTSPLGMGVRVSRFAKGGTYLGVQAAANNPDTIGSQTTDDSLTTLFGMSQPDLAIFIPGTNEYFQQITQAQYTTGLTTLVTRARAVNSDVLFLSTVPPQSALAVPLSTYNATLYAVADSLNVPVLDITDRWQDYNTSSVAPYLFYADGNHPTDRGHWDLSDALAKAVDLILGSP